MDSLLCYSLFQSNIILMTQYHAIALPEAAVALKLHWIKRVLVGVGVGGGVGGREVVRSVPAKVAPSDVGARRYSPVTMGTPAIGSQLPCCPVKILSVQHENRLNLYV